MKRFTKITDNPMGFTTVNVLTQVLVSAGQQQGLNVQQIRERIRMLDEVEREGDAVELPEHDYKVLCDLLNGFPFGTAHRDLLKVVDGVLEAETVKGH